MPEGVTPYPRWQGTTVSGGRWQVVMQADLQRAYRGTWSMLALLLGLGWGAASIIEMIQFAQTADSHELGWYTAMLDQLRWAALAVAAAVGGRLLDDARQGALELYMARDLSQRGYLLGKGGAVMLLCTGVTVLPAVLYYLASLAFYDSHPAGWHGRAAIGIAYALLWAVMVGGLAMGLACVTRSSRGASLLLFAGFAGLDIVVSGLLSGLTGNAELTIISPFVAVEAMAPWFFGTEPTHDFPAWWGLAHWGTLTILGWALVAWRHPRVRGVDHV